MIERRKRRKPDHLYVLYSRIGRKFKIGISAIPETRFQAIRSEVNLTDLQCLYCKQLSDEKTARYEETRLKVMLHNKRDEWLPWTYENIKRLGRLLSQTPDGKIKIIISPRMYGSDD